MQFCCQNIKYGHTITTFFTFDFKNEVISRFEVEIFTFDYHLPYMFTDTELHRENMFVNDLLNEILYFLKYLKI